MQPTVVGDGDATTADVMAIAMVVATVTALQLRLRLLLLTMAAFGIVMAQYSYLRLQIIRAVACFQESEVGPNLVVVRGDHLEHL